MSGRLRISLFCSASEIVDPLILDAAKDFARGLARRDWELLYGGGRSGLMGFFADQALAAGGVVRGATTEDLARGAEGLHPGLHESLIMKDLFERKKWLLEQADGFAVFPGGFGTLDEVLEAITWKALGCHDKPIVFVNVSDFWHDQLQTFQNMMKRGVIRSKGFELYSVSSSVEDAWKVFEHALMGKR